MKKLFLPYDLSYALKEIGFDEECMAMWEDNKLAPPPLLHIFYSNKPTDTSLWKEDYKQQYEKRPKMFDGEKNINSKLSEWLASAPLYDQVIEWLINKYRICIETGIGTSGNYFYQIMEFTTGASGWKSTTSFIWGFATRKDALNTGITKAIEIIKEKGEVENNN